MGILAESTFITMKVFIVVAVLVAAAWAEEECIDDDPHCKKFDAEELIMYCNDPSTGVGKGCCESCKGYMKPTLVKREVDEECVDNYEVCGEYHPHDLDNYCNDESTGVAEECCASCKDYIKAAPAKLVKREVDEECVDNYEVCAEYKPFEREMYCNDPSTGVAEECCASCKDYIKAELFKRAEEEECVDNPKYAEAACQKYDEEELELYCNDPETGVNVVCCATCKPYFKAEEEEEDVAVLKRSIDFPEVCEDSKDEYGAHCKGYSARDLDKYCPDESTGLLEVCCGTCQAHFNGN